MTANKPTLRDQLGGHVAPEAKAVAAFLTPLGAALVAWLVQRTGVELPYDPSAVEAFLTSIVTTVFVWAISNRRPSASP